MSEGEKPLLMVFPMELASHYLRCLALCKRLEGNFRLEISYSRVYDRFIDEAGLKTFKTLRFGQEEVKGPVTNFDFSWLSRERLSEVLESQVEAIAERKPCAVLGDTSFTLKMAAEKTGTRFISVLNGYMTKYYGLWRGVPRAHPGYQYSNKMPRAMFERVARVMEYRSLRSVHEPFRSVRGVQGLPRTEYLLDELEGDLNLVCDLPRLFPLRNAPTNYAHIGPLFHAGKSDESEALSFLDGGSPNVLVTMGSSGDWKKLKFLEDHVFRKYRFVLSGDGDGTITIPDSFSRPFINHVSILPKIDLVICHGGNGTIYQALSEGIPVLSIPGNFEAEWNSNRLQEMGLGEVIEARYSPERIDIMMQSWMKKGRGPQFMETGRDIMAYQGMSINIGPTTG